MELNYLKYFIETYYYQSVWDFCDNHIDIFNEFTSESQQIKTGLRDNVTLLLEQGPNVIFEIINEFGEDAGGLSFDTVEEVISFLISLKEFLDGNKKVVQ